MGDRIKKFCIISAIVIMSVIIVRQLFVMPGFIGIANNGDFWRISYKLGIGNKLDISIPENYPKTFFNYFVDRYNFVTPIKTGFFTTTEYLLQIAKYLNWRFNSLGDFDIKWMGFVSYLLYISGISICLFCLYKIKKTSEVALFSVLAVLFFSDMYIVQYFNSFYSEATSIIFLIFYLNCVLLYITFQRSYAFRWLMFLLELLFQYLFIGSKYQNFLFIIPCLIISILQIVDLLRPIKAYLTKSLVIFFYVVVILLTIFVNVFPSITAFTDSSGYADRVGAFNVILANLLLYSSSPETQLEKMGFQANEIIEVKQKIGKNYYLVDQDFIDKYSPYFTREAEINMLLNEPSLVLKTLEKDAKFLFQLDQYGNYREVDGLKPAQKAQRFNVLTLIQATIYPRNFWFFSGIIAATFIYSIYKMIKNKCLLSMNYYYVLVFLCLGAVFTYATSVFGDDTHDIYKHYFLTNIIFNVLLLFLVYLIAQDLLARLAVKVNLSGVVDRLRTEAGKLIMSGKARAFGKLKR